MFLKNATGELSAASVGDFAILRTAQLVPEPAFSLAYSGKSSIAETDRAWYTPGSPENALGRSVIRPGTLEGRLQQVGCCADGSALRTLDQSRAVPQLSCPQRGNLRLVPSGAKKCARCFSLLSPTMKKKKDFVFASLSPATHEFAISTPLSC